MVGLGWLVVVGAAVVGAAVVGAAVVVAERPLLLITIYYIIIDKFINYYY